MSSTTTPVPGAGTDPPRESDARAASTGVDRLPASVGGFLGRVEELAELRGLLERDRLITVTGAPGVGKTRLVRELTERYQGQAVFVDLAAVADPALVPAAAAFALSVQEFPGVSVGESVIAGLRRGGSLLVLDNCEHLIGACREFADSLLRGCPELLIVATSREPLGVEGERVWLLSPFAVPACGEPAVPEVLMGYPSVCLFVERAGAAQPGFVLNSYVAPAVAEVCRRLDGIPLAIELAAARVDMLTPAEIDARLDDRFDLLTGGSGGVGRYETLEAALDWSYELLSSAERALLRRLSVFVGGFDVASVEGVCAGDEVLAGACLPLLEALVSKSLVALDAGGAPETRYRLLETISAYARDRLEQAGEAARLRMAHAGFYLGVAETREPELTSSAQARALGRLDSEHDNIRRALQWCLGHTRGDWALRMAGALVLFWRVRCRFSEGKDMLEAALSASDGGDPRLRAKAMWGAGFMTLMAGDPERAVPQLDSSLAGFREQGEPQGAARALLILANCNFYRDGASIEPLLVESAALAREAGDGWCHAHALGLAGFRAMARGQFAVGRGQFEQCLAVAREAQDNQGLRFGLIGLGSVAMLQGDYRPAQELLQEGLAIASELGEDYSVAEALQWLGWLALEGGDPARARELLEDALALIPEVAPPHTAADALLLLGRVAHVAGDRTAALRRFDEARSRGGSGARWALAWRGDLAIDEGDLDEAHRLFEQALAHARAFSGVDSVATALHGLGRLAREAGDLWNAASLHKEALELQHEIGAAPAMVASVEALGGLAAVAGSHHHAAELLGAAAGLRHDRGYARKPWEAVRYEDDVALARAGLHAPAFEEAFIDGRNLCLDEAAALAIKGNGSRDRPSSGWASLTDRERQVADMAAEGLTNPEIADRLVITRATVKNHLSRVFAKLGITRRSDLARESPRDPTA